MGLLDLFRKPAIRTLDELSQFIDGQAAFLMQKGIYEYSRARAGHYAKVLFSEPIFLEAVEKARWRAYPLGLAMVGELAEGILRPHAGGDTARQQIAVRILVLSVFDRYQVPQPLDTAEWQGERKELDRRLQLITLHPPKRSFAIPDQYERTYFELMPIHARLRAPDRPVMHSYLKVTLCNMHEELSRRADLAGLAGELGRMPGKD